MPAETNGPLLPISLEETAMICFNGRKFPFITFFIIHMSVRELSEFIDIYSRKSRTESKIHILGFLLNKVSQLIRDVSNISLAAWAEAFYASLALQRFWWDDDEPSALESKQRLLRVNEILSLDQIISKKSVVD